MANKRNRANRSRRHVYFTRKPKRQIQKQHTGNLREVQNQGSRIVNLQNLEGYVSMIAKHAAECPSSGPSSIVIDDELRLGLASVLKTKCTGCGVSLKLQTSQRVKGPKGDTQWESNLAAVWGQMATGGGHSKLQETMGVLGIPVMAKHHFTGRYMQELRYITIP